MKKIQIQTDSHTQLLDITQHIQQNIEQGYSAVILYVPHTTCALMINEGADPDVRRDITNTLDSLIPWDANYLHREGNSAAHIKSILIGNSVTIIIDHDHLQLGTWEKIFLCEFDGPRTRTIWLQFLS